MYGPDYERSQRIRRRPGRHYDARETAILRFRSSRRVALLRRHCPLLHRRIDNGWRTGRRGAVSRNRAFPACFATGRSLTRHAISYQTLGGSTFIRSRGNVHYRPGGTTVPAGTSFDPGTTHSLHRFTRTDGEDHGTAAKGIAHGRHRIRLRRAPKLARKAAEPITRRCGNTAGSYSAERRRTSFTS